MLTSYGKRVLGIALIMVVFSIIGLAMCATADEQADQYETSKSDAGSGHSGIMGN